MPDVGEVLIRGVRCLAWDGGTRAAAEGRDLATACRGLTDDRLRFWAGWIGEKGAMPHEHRVLLAEMERRGLKAAQPEPRKPARAAEPEDEPGQLVMWKGS